ncbi:MAG: carboxypeptidase regulatory-like domain-containing protein [Planctomycetales bacterium]|nr:carboxypeptidase regulatory-like domain-containing protein [Planctomycetales bacterium]
MNKRFNYFLTCLTLSLLAGCGGVKLYPVAGTVTMDGKPMEGLLVAFAGDGGITATGTTDTNGAYQLTSIKGRGLPAGNYRVSITHVAVQENSGSQQQESEMASSSNSAAYEQQAMGNPTAYKAAEKKKSKIPDKYNSQSTLQEMVAETENVIDFALSSK